MKFSSTWIFWAKRKEIKKKCAIFCIFVEKKIQKERKKVLKFEILNLIKLFFLLLSGVWWINFKVNEKKANKKEIRKIRARKEKKKKLNEKKCKYRTFVFGVSLKEKSSSSVFHAQWRGQRNI